MIKNIKCLIIGYGSIGKKHASVLKKIVGYKNIYILSKKNIKDYLILKNLNQLREHQFDYIIISTPTSTHLKQLKFLEKFSRKSTILIEKPLFSKFKNYKPKNKKIFVGYNLRYNRLIKHLKKNINKKEIFSITINCASFLPDWRKNIHYTKTYSSQKKLGGGILNELSHELDYFQFIFQKIKFKDISNVMLKKSSNLKVDVEDSALIQGKINNLNYIFNFNFFSKFKKREIIIESFKETTVCNLLNNSILIFSKLKKNTKKVKFLKNDTYFELHNDILNKKKNKLACNYQDGLKILKLIETIKKKCHL